MISPADHDLLQAYVEGRLAAEESGALEARLKADQQLALAYLALARDETVYARWGSLAQEPEARGQEPGVRSQEPSSRNGHKHDVAPANTRTSVTTGRRPIWLAPLAVTAAVLLVAFGIYFLSGPTPDVAVVPSPPQPTAPAPVDSRPILAQIQDIQGQVFVVDAGQPQRIQSSQPIRTGQGIRLENDGSSAVIRYEDGTVLELGPNTQVRLEQDGGKRVYVTSGVLTANVAKQQTPMIVSTPHAEIKVLGTRFCSISGTQATQVELEEGKIELTRKSDGQTIEVQPGTFAVATAKTEALAPLPLPAKITRERRQFIVGEGPVLSLAISPDGKLLAGGGWQGTVRVWNHLTGEDFRVFSGHSRKVRALVFTPDSRRLISASEDKSIQVWNLADGTLEKTLPSHRDLEALAVSPDGKLLAAGGWGRAATEIQLFDLQTLQPVHTFQRHQASVTSLAFSPDSKFLASGAKDGTAKLWDLAKRSELVTLATSSQQVKSVAFSPDGQRLAIGTSDGAIQLWDWLAAEVKVSWQSRMGTVTCVAFSPDGRILGTSGGRGSVTLWDLTTRGEGPTIHGHQYMIPAIAFHPDGKSLATAGWDRLVKLWDLTGDPGLPKNR